MPKNIIPFTPASTQASSRFFMLSAVSLINGRIGVSHTTVGIPASLHFIRTLMRSLVVETSGSMPVHSQCCAAMDGSTSPDVPGKAHSGPYTSLRNQLKQAYLAFLIFAQRNQTCQRHPENCALHCPLIPKYHFAKLYQITLTNISISHIL